MFTLLVPSMPAERIGEDMAPIKTVTGFRMEFPEVRDVAHFDAMRDARQIAVSSDGTRTAVVTADRDDGFDVLHFSEPRLDVGAKEIRLLGVQPSRDRAWVRMPDGSAGVYAISQFGVTRRCRLDTFENVRRSPFGLIAYGRNRGDPDTHVRYVVGTGSALLHRDAEVTIGHNGILTVFDHCRGTCERVTVQPDGQVHEPMRVPAGSFNRLRPLRWMGLDVVLVQRNGRDAIWGVAPDEIDVGGTVDIAWSAPDGNAVALLVQCRASDDPRGPYRKLLVGGRNLARPNKIEVVAQGRFRMEPEDLRWSASGRHFGAALTHLNLEDDIDAPRITEESWLVTSDGEERSVPAEARVANFAVNDAGEITGHVRSQGGMHVPIIGEVELDPVPRAWNMRVAGANRITYNVLLDMETCARVSAVAAR